MSLAKAASICIATKIYLFQAWNGQWKLSLPGRPNIWDIFRGFQREANISEIKNREIKSGLNHDFQATRSAKITAKYSQLRAILVKFTFDEAADFIGKVSKIIWLYFCQSCSIFEEERPQKCSMLSLRRQYNDITIATCLLLISFISWLLYKYMFLKFVFKWEMQYNYHQKNKD